MKKIRLMTVTALTLASLGSQALAVQAAPAKQGQLLPNGNGMIFTYSSNCNIQDILGKLENCFPNISLPDCDLPGDNTPDVDSPGTENPDSNSPETENPDNNSPETENPDNNSPETENPETNLPGTDTPENSPGNGSAGENTPEDAPSDEHAFIRQVVDLVNAERAKEGLSPLTIDTNVQAAAMVRAKECEQLFSHTRPDGSSFVTALKEQNVSYKGAGENIAWGQRSPEEVMNAWMNSSGHRANIMNSSFTTIGVGYYQNANGTGYWCQLFTR